MEKERADEMEVAAQAIEEGEKKEKAEKTGREIRFFLEPFKRD